MKTPSLVSILIPSFDSAGDRSPAQIRQVFDIEDGDLVEIDVRPVTGGEGRTTERPTTEELKLVARHGSGAIERSLAVVELAKRQGRLDELVEVTED